MHVFTEKLKAILENKKQRRNQDGFTLLELLVVVAILAAIAGTATIALKDTDARASAAAHVAMMDELNKGIRTYRILKKNELPSRFDSLLASADGSTVSTAADPGMLGFDLGVDAIIGTVDDEVEAIMIDGGLTSLMYIDQTVADTDQEGYDFDSSVTTPCDAANIQSLINSRKNAVVAGNIFMTPEANGCGFEFPLNSTDTTGIQVVLWNGGTERLTGVPSAATNFWDDGEIVYMITGIGPSSTLFNVNELGGMTTVPIYRHVKADEYGRFMAVWNIGTYSGSSDGTTGIDAGEQLELVAIVDGALDTKEEELGEWDGTRNTI